MVTKLNAVNKFCHLLLKCNELVTFNFGTDHNLKTVSNKAPFMSSSKFKKVTEAMRQGSSLHKALEDNLDGSGFLVHMVGSGEASSELDKMLLRVAEYYSVRLNNTVEVFLKLLNPILIIIMGAMILGIVAAIMLPIMDMNNAI